MESTRNHDANDYDYPPEVVIQAVLRRQLQMHLLVPNTRSWINDEDLLPMARTSRKPLWTLESDLDDTPWSFYDIFMNDTNRHDRDKSRGFFSLFNSDINEAIPEVNTTEMSGEDPPNSIRIIKTRNAEGKGAKMARWTEYVTVTTEDNQ
ncbi:hypothetical protein BDF22DRAFT_741947 [Syncephalis plumigaleata]|nr:hypothetical protein BDF22DRAFT_741947 [Syncephalis plumigaleata]